MVGFDMFDEIRVGFITEAELNGKVLASNFPFAILDANGDGRIDRREYTLAFDLLDICQGGRISRTEFHCASHAAFSLLDTDHDGKLTKAKYMARFCIFDTDHNGFVNCIIKCMI